jgi:uncharacterized GH25 family protein
MKKIYAMVFLLVFSVSAFAHEYWFEADKFFVAPKEKTAIHLFVGEALKHDEERAFQLSKTNLLRLYSADDNLDLKTSLTDEALPIYNFSADKAGNYLFVLERNWSYIKLAPKDFEDYLREDGMEYIIAEREKLGESQKIASERYSRFLKTLLQVGNKHDATFKKIAGMKLEIVPLENPYSKKVGDNLKMQILFDGKPLADKTVFANNRENTDVSSQKLTTDKNGKISVKLDRKGVWLIRLVFMQRCKTDCKEADWESFWGGFSFGVR